jgi:hypothetical protein
MATIVNNGSFSFTNGTTPTTDTVEAVVEVPVIVEAAVEVPVIVEAVSSTTRVQSSDRMSNAGYHRAGKAWWWLRGPEGFVKVPSVRGDKYFDSELELAPGAYTLGVGKGKDAIREQFEV